MRIPDTFRGDDADYLTLPAMKTFCYENGLETNLNRKEIIEEIENYASKSDENNDSTQRWLNHILKVGIKTIAISKIFTGIKKIETIERAIKIKYVEYIEKNICECNPTNELKLIRYKINEKGGNINSISFVFIIRLVKAEDLYKSSGNIILFPIFVDVDYVNNYVISRYKSVSGIFKVSKGTEIDSKMKTSTEKLKFECEEIVRGILLYTKEETIISKSNFKRTIFNILNEYTNTPGEIQKMIDDTKDDCESFRLNLFDKLGLDVNDENINDAKYDLQIFVEKYCSITHPDETIFTKDRMAFPVKFIAQDNEFTKIQETSSGNEDPLQRKKAFFDSKKSVYTDRKCDKICLCHQREPKRYYGDKPFNVQIYIDNGKCMVKFLRFVEEDDIQNVLSRILQLYNVQD